MLGTNGQATEHIGQNEGVWQPVGPTRRKREPRMALLRGSIYCTRVYERTGSQTHNVPADYAPSSSTANSARAAGQRTGGSAEPVTGRSAGRTHHRPGHDHDPLERGP